MEKAKAKKRRFGLAPRMIIGVIVIALAITSLSVYIGAKSYWDDITEHYNSMAKNIADTMQGVLDRDKLVKWGDITMRFCKAYNALPPKEEEASDDTAAEEETEPYNMDMPKAIEASIEFVNNSGVDESLKQEVMTVLNDPEYQEIMDLTFNLCANMKLNDIYIFYLDTDIIDDFTQEKFDNYEWKPIMYLMDTYADPSWWFPIGESSRVDEDQRDMLKEKYLNGLQPDFGGPLTTYFTDKYILTSMTNVVYEGKAVAAVGVEVPMPTLEEDMHNYIWKIVLVDLAALGGLLVILIILIIFFVTRPIKKVAREAQRFVSDNAEVSDKLAKIHTHDEIQTLSESLLSLEYGVRDYIDDIKKMTAEKEHLGAELSIATKIQADMLPRNFPDSSDYSIYATMTPAKEVGGDFYDFFKIDDDHIAIVMADVSGKGVPASLFMVISKTLIKNRTLSGGDPAKILEDVNNQLCENNEAGLFVTAWLGILEISSGILTVCNAGHEYPFIRRKDGDYEFFENDNLPPLAAMEDIEYENTTMKLNKGDEIFLYTDGVPEAKNNDSGAHFGMEKTAEVLNRNKDKPLKEQLEELKKEIDTFTGGGVPFDDVTMLIFKLNE